METREYKVYKFAELTDDQKQRAIENLADINVDYDWWDWLVEEAKTIGLTFDGLGGQNCSGSIYDHEDTANKILSEHGEKCDTHQTAVNYLKERAELVTKHSDGTNTDIVAEDNEYDFDNECEDIDAEFLHSLLEDYRIMYNKEYESLTSKKPIIETIEANDYDFTEDGKIDYPLI